MHQWDPSPGRTHPARGGIPLSLNNVPQPPPPEEATLPSDAAARFGDPNRLIARPGHGEIWLGRATRFRLEPVADPEYDRRLAATRPTRKPLHLLDARLLHPLAVTEAVVPRVGHLGLAR